MRSLFAFVGGALVALAGLGWYFNWYTIVKEPTSAGHTRYGIDVDTNKVKNDVQHGVEAGANGIQKIVNGKQEPVKTP